MENNEQYKSDKYPKAKDVKSLGYRLGQIFAAVCMGSLSAITLAGTIKLIIWIFTL